MNKRKKMLLANVLEILNKENKPVFYENLEQDTRQLASDLEFEFGIDINEYVMINNELIHKSELENDNIEL